MSNTLKTIYTQRLQEFKDLLFEYFHKDKIKSVTIRGLKVVIVGDLCSKNTVTINPFASLAVKSPNLRIYEVVGNIATNRIKDFTLRYFPEVVRGDFNCAGMGLESLIGSPSYVGGTFNADMNNLKTLEGSPRYVGGNYSVDSNDLSSLDGVSPYIGGNLFCCDNPGSAEFTKPSGVSKELLNF